MRIKGCATPSFRPCWGTGGRIRIIRPGGILPFHENPPQISAKRGLKGDDGKEMDRVNIALLRRLAGES